MLKNRCTKNRRNIHFLGLRFWASVRQVVRQRVLTPAVVTGSGKRWGGSFRIAAAASGGVWASLARAWAWPIPTRACSLEGVEGVEDVAKQGVPQRGAPGIALDHDHVVGLYDGVGHFAGTDFVKVEHLRL